MANDNFIVAVSRFDTGGPWGFRSPDAGDFNSTAGGAFGAQVVFIPRGALQNPPPDAQFLWGNRDAGSAPNRGWALQLADNAGQLALVGSVGLGGSVVTVTYDITGASTPGWAERAICAGLWLTVAADPVAYLTINGMIVDSAAAGALAPSVSPVSLGISPVTPADAAATDTDIVSAAYTYNVAFNNAGDVGDFSSRAFAAERAAFGGNALEPAYGLDWVHRYSARSLTQGLAATISKTPAGARLVFDTLPQPFGYPAVANAPWPDIGNLLVTDVSAAIPTIPYSPINLNRIGPLFQGAVPQPLIVGRKNVDWYTGGSYTFPVA